MTDEELFAAITEENEARVANGFPPLKGGFHFAKGDFEPYHTVPHMRGNNYLVQIDIGCPYITDLIEQIGRERFVILPNDVVFARDEEALTLWNLAFDEAQEQASLLEMWGRS